MPELSRDVMALYVSGLARRKHCVGLGGCGSLLD